MNPAPTITVDGTSIPRRSPGASTSAWGLAQVAIKRAQQDDSKKVLVLSFSAPSGDPLGWLGHHHGVPSVYWRGRDGWEYAGLGVSHLIAAQGVEAMQSCADSASRFLREDVIHESSPQARRPRFFGGFAFDPAHPARQEWDESGFNDAVLVLPEAVYAHKDTQSYLFFSFEVTPRSTPDALVDRLAILNESYWHGFECPARAPLLDNLIASEDSSARGTDWLRRCSRIVSDLQSGTIDKVVLAQRVAARLASASADVLNPWPLVAALRDFDPICYQFAFQFNDRYAFVGASPEQLFRLSGRQLESEAVAGTIVRGHSEDEDNRLEEQLVRSAKDQLEHQYVVDAIRAGLGQLSAGQSPAARSRLDVVRLKTLQHLRSLMSIEVRDDVTVGAVLSTLHPTPAVAGVPREEALEAIRDQEPVARGWYGGPVGWIGADAAEFAVGIRSALLSVDRAWLYAGAGLVRGSVPEEEWREVQNKLQAFQSAANSPRPLPLT